MAPNKFEERIREKLREREIQPSGESWAKLEARLEKDKGSGSSNRIWYAIAAGFVGVIILASLFFTGSKDENQFVVEDEVMETPFEIEEITPPEINEAEEIVTSKEDSPGESSQEVAIESTVQKPEKVEKANNMKKAISPSPRIAEVKKENKSSDPTSTDELKETTEVEEERFIQGKVDEVVAEVGKIQDSGKEVRAEDIDKLLLEAQKEISKNRILNSSTRKVDAAALLSDVELELERSFRDKVFDALGDGFNKIRTAMAERNY